MTADRGRPTAYGLRLTAPPTKPAQRGELAVSGYGLTVGLSPVTDVEDTDSARGGVVLL